MEPWIGFLGAVLGALAGTIGAGYWSLRLQREQHDHLLTTQQEQWDREDKLREDQRQHDHQQELDREQRDIWRELQEVVPRFMFTAQWVYHRKLELYREYKKTGLNEHIEDKSQEAKDTMAQFKELRERLRVIQARILDEKLRLAVSVIGAIGLDMVDTNPMFWVQSENFYNGHDPQTLIYPRVQQANEMLGTLLRGESIDRFLVVEDAREIPVER